MLPFTLDPIVSLGIASHTATANSLLVVFKERMHFLTDRAKQLKAMAPIPATFEQKMTIALGFDVLEQGLAAIEENRCWLTDLTIDLLDELKSNLPVLMATYEKILNVE